MIPITKDEKEILARMFPYEKFPRTMRQDSKRHHYFCTEREDMMGVIAESNSAAAEFIKQCEAQRALRVRRRKAGGS